MATSTTIAPRAIYNVEYNIPRVNLSFSGRQNRSHSGDLRISPGMFEPIEFDMMNVDGVPINLAHFTVKFVVWKTKSRDLVYSSIMQNDIVFSKEMEIIDCYEGRFVLFLDDNDTLLISRPGLSTLRWSIFFINSDNQVFPGQITSNGGRYGQLQIDVDAQLPTSDMILGLAG